MNTSMKRVHSERRIELNKLGEYVYVVTEKAKTTAERQRDYRRALADAGRVEVRGIFAHPDDHAAIKEHAAKLLKRRESRSATHPHTRGDKT